jgi:cobalt-zinc-cadmium efflux system membrane fusion protein
MRLGSFIPTLLALAAVAGLVVAGQRCGWKMPRFSALLGSAEEEPDDWCGEHGVPASICVECKTGACAKDGCCDKGPSFGWCRKHGVHECPLCHPEVAQLPSPLVITPELLARAEAALRFSERPENGSKCRLHLRRLQFASLVAMQKAGVGVGAVSVGAVSESVSAPGEITFDPTRVARLSSRLPGSVWRVEKQIGDRVQAGELLALVEAADVGKSKSEFLRALLQVQLKARTLAGLKDSAGVAERSIVEAQAALDEAQIQLVTARQALVNLGFSVNADELRGLTPEEAARRVQFLGLSESVIRSLDPRTSTVNLLPLRAPLDGMVVSREVVPGEMADATKVLFVVADPSRMWLTLQVRLEDVRRLKLGLPVRFTPDGEAMLEGKVEWISTAADEKTRTVKVRTQLDNAAGRLRARTFGTGTILLREEKQAIVVPAEALHWEGCCHVVFVRDRNFESDDAPKVFHVRKVVPGAKDEKEVEIIAGVLPGEVVATLGSGVLRSELLKNSLGEG